MFDKTNHLWVTLHLFLMKDSQPHTPMSNADKLHVFGKTNYLWVTIFILMKDSWINYLYMVFPLF